MFKSRYSDNEKRSILQEKVTAGMTVREICEKYHITTQTYYLWRHKYDVSVSLPAALPEEGELNLVDENRTLRRLYINLSAHNYELAQFLKND